MFGTISNRQRRRGSRLWVEGLEDRRLLATLLAGYAESSVAAGITSATAMEVAPDGRIWVLEQAGEVEVFHAGSTAGAVALDIPASAIDHTGERGLLGIAFDPSYDITSSAPDYVYLYYTSTAGGATHNRVSRFAVDNTDPDHPTLSNETVLIDLDPLSPTNHNGGAIHFGPDGKLYIGVGDNGNGNNAQSLTTRLGKILRINSDGSIPADNPTSFPGIAGTTTGADRAIWAVGLRNPYTFAFQPGTGRLFINDVGLSSFEEIDPGQAGANYGWPVTEGIFDQATYPSFTEPIYSYAHGTGTFQGDAITGGTFYDPATSASAHLPTSYTGDYFFADDSNGWIDVIDPTTGAVAQFASDTSFPVDLKVAADGSLLYLSIGQGIVSSIAPVAGSAPTISLAPQDQAVTANASATFTVAAIGLAPLTYQWQRAEPGSADFASIVGATGSSYTLAAATTGDAAARFRVVVTNAFGSAASDPATLTVIPASLATATAILQVTPATSLFGQAISLVAAVGSASGGSATPTGIVAFEDGSTVLGTAPLVGGIASFSTATLAPGLHALTALYLGDAVFSLANSASILQSVTIATAGGAGTPLVVVATGSEESIRLAGTDGGRQVGVTVEAAGASFGQVYFNGTLPPIQLMAGAAKQTATLSGQFIGPLALSRSAVPGLLGPTVVPPVVTLSRTRSQTLTVSGAGRDATVSLTGLAGGRMIRVVVRVAGRSRPIFTRTFVASRLAGIDLGAGVGARSVRVTGRVATSITFHGALS